MKIKKLIIITLLLVSGYPVLAQDSDKLVKDPKTGNDMIVGEVTREGLVNLDSWFNEEYSLYQPDSLAIQLLKQNRDNLPYIFVVMGTWCGDSREHVPHFYKIIDLVDYPKEKIFIVGVDRDKKGGDFCLADFEINLVPTFIFTQKGKELGRIIETPVVSLEHDMVNIIKDVN